MTILRAGLWLLVERVGTVALGMAATALIARQYGVTAFGAYSYVDALSTFLLFLPTLGLDHLISRDVVNHPERQGQILGSVYAMQMVGWVLYVLAVIGVVAVNGTLELYGGIAVAVVLTTFFNRMAVVRTVFEAVHHTGPVSVGMLCSRVASLGYLLWAVNTAQSLALALLYLPLQAFLFWAGLVVLTPRGRAVVAKLSVSGTQIRHYAKEALPLIGASIAYPVFSHFGFLMAQDTVNAHDAGLYAAAQKFIIQLTVIGNLVAVVLFPKVLQAQAVSADLYQARLRDAARLAAGISTAIVIFMVIASPLIIRTLYGTEFSESATILQVLSLTILFSFPAGLYTRLLIADGLGRIELFKAVGGGITSIAATVVFAKMWGLWGIVAGTVVGYCVVDFAIYAVLPASRPLFKVQVMSLLTVASPQKMLSALRAFRT